MHRICSGACLPGPSFKVGPSLMVLLLGSSDFPACAFSSCALLNPSPRPKSAVKAEPSRAVEEELGKGSGSAFALTEQALAPPLLVAASSKPFSLAWE